MKQPIMAVSCVIVAVVALFAGTAALHTSTSRPSLAGAFNNQWNFLSFGLKGGVNGGDGCAGCTLLLGLFEQTMQIHEVPADRAIESLCRKIPAPYGTICVSFFEQYGPLIFDLLEAKETPDVICNSIKLCDNKSGQQCRLFPKPKLFEERIQKHRTRLEPQLKDIRAFNICTIIPEVCQMENHLPAFDEDLDRFSSWKTLRGNYWRGKDCNAYDNTVHPGRVSDANEMDAFADTNCNGIWGMDNKSFVPYEQEWCQGTQEMGLAILGDSATAHFRIPPNWVTASKLNAGDLEQVPMVVENELDWPMFSWSTGHLNTSAFAPGISGPVNSMYLELRRRNLCNNNDYQNLGNNGAKAQDLPTFAKLLGRTRASPAQKVKKNKPLMLFMAMIGNDVCNHHHTFDTMTTIEEYYNKTLEAVLYADSILEPGSSIVLVGLADGRILYDNMHDRIHPIGSTNNDVTYKDLYDFLNCLDISPCWGWMNSDPAIRNKTSAHAAALSQQLYNVERAAKPQLKNTRILVETNWVEALKRSPYPIWELIEPVDGFHPSQLGNYLIAHYMINKTHDAGLLPPENPNNAKIAEVFGL